MFENSIFKASHYQLGNFDRSVDSSVRLNARTIVLIMIFADETEGVKCLVFVGTMYSKHLTFQYLGRFTYTLHFLQDHPRPRSPNSAIRPAE